MTKLIPILKKILNNKDTDENSQARLAENIQEWLLGHRDKIYKEGSLSQRALVDIIKEELDSFSVSHLCQSKLFLIFITLDESDIPKRESSAHCFIAPFIRGLIIAINSSPGDNTGEKSSQEQEQTTTQELLFNKLALKSDMKNALKAFIQFLAEDETQTSNQPLYVALDNFCSMYEHPTKLLLFKECQRYMKHLKNNHKPKALLLKLKL